MTYYVDDVETIPIKRHEVVRSRAAKPSEIAESALAPSEIAPPLADLLGTFYQAEPELATIAVQIAVPEVEAGILRRLGTAPAGLDTDLRRVY